MTGVLWPGWTFPEWMPGSDGLFLASMLKSWMAAPLLGRVIVTSVRKTAPVSLRLDRHAFDRLIERCDVDLFHVHHRFEGPLCALTAFAC